LMKGFSSLPGPGATVISNATFYAGGDAYLEVDLRVPRPRADNSLPQINIGSSLSSEDIGYFGE
jgi:hypothetical protein